MCPSDYDDARQTDSDCGNDPEYRPEVENPPATPASPQLTGGEGPSTSTADRRTQRQKNKQARQDSLDAARKELKAISHLLTSPTREEDDDEISRPKPPKKREYQRHTPSVVWDHFKKSGTGTEEKVQCNYCIKYWRNLSGSTSTPLKHLRGTHYDKLTDEQKKKCQMMVKRVTKMVQCQR